MQKLDSLRADARVGNLPDAGGMTVGQLLDRWLMSSKSRTETRTFEERDRLVKNHLRPRLGGLKLAKVTTLHVEGLYADMASDGVGASTVRHAADVLGVALSHACKLKLIPYNPVAAVPKPKEPAREMLFLTPEQVKILLAAALDQRCYPLLVLALATGCRQGELLALIWEDVDLQKGILTVRRSLAQTDRGFELKEPKTAASRRTIALPDLAVRVLTLHKAEAMKAGLLSSPVFCTRDGGYLLKRNVLRSLRAVVRRANTPPGKINRGGRPKKGEGRGRRSRSSRSNSSPRSCGSTTSGTRSRACCCRKGSPSAPSASGWATATRPSRCEFTPTTCPATTHNSRQA